MPNAIIIVDNFKRAGFSEDVVLTKMVKAGLINRVLVKGVRVYGRHYLPPRAIREAYYKQAK